MQPLGGVIGLHKHGYDGPYSVMDLTESSPTFVFLKHIPRQQTCSSAPMIDVFYIIRHAPLPVVFDKIIYSRMYLALL